MQPSTQIRQTMKREISNLRISFQLRLNSGDGGKKFAENEFLPEHNAQLVTRKPADCIFSQTLKEQEVKTVKAFDVTINI